MFRGILQNLLEKSIGAGRPGRWALIIASTIFGASHFHHPPVPNWRYCIMATVAGILYGIAYRTRRRISSPALTHALVDTLWHFWF
jgi:membrane protease YdiL (CAAX protease family)